VSNVNPPPIPRIPPELMRSPQMRGYFEELRRIIFQLWVRTGGGNDAVDEIRNGELYEPGIETSNSSEVAEEAQIDHEIFGLTLSILERVEDLEAFTFPSFGVGEEKDVLDIPPADTARSTTGDQIVICRNSSPLTLTLNPNPRDGEKVTIIRKDASVTIVGNINGGASVMLSSKNDILDVYYTLAAGEWSA